MKFSEQWLREWVNPSISTDELVEQLTMAGLEVDAVEPAAAAFEKVVVGEVKELEPHPDADKLRVTRVDVGEDELLQIVCGAANVAVGMKVPTALVGAVLPGDMKIKKAKLRGVPSAGMLCSAKEIGLAEEASGLLPLAEDAPVGMNIRDFYKLDDACIDVDLTPNRSDCLGIEGIAREVAVLNRVEICRPVITPVAAEHDENFSVKVSAPEACPRYLGRIIKDVNVNAETPVWMQERLRRSGIRSLGPVVDVTNYVLLELGQPMHGFDLNILSGAIDVRYAADNEKLVLLDGKEVALDSDTLVIADANGPLALAGIMGGEKSGVTDQTKDIFLECAFFTPTVIAGRARRYGMQTDSSFRFERGVDYQLQARAMERATALLVEIAGGSAGPVSEVCSDSHLPVPATITLRHERVTKLLGLSLPESEIEEILVRLGCAVDKTTGGWHVTAPSYRFDFSIEADLIEDIGRIYGYNRLPTSAPRGDLKMSVRPEAQRPLDRFRNLLVDRDYQEAITYSFVDEEMQSLLSPAIKPVALANPISADLSVMRTSLWAGLLRAVEYNLNRQQSRVRLFEQGLNYFPQDNDFKQERYLAGVICGERLAEQWASEKGQLVDFYDVKGDVEALLATAGNAANFTFESGKHPALHPGRTACLKRDGAVVGYLGSIHPELARKLKIPKHIQLFELQLDALENGEIAAFEALSKFPAIRRDLSFNVSREVLADEIRGVIADQGLTALKEIRVFDVYEGQGVEKGLKSIALGLILQDSSRTLTDQDVEEIITRVITALKEKTGASLRE